MLTHPNTHTHAHIFGSDAGKSDQVRGIEWLVIWMIDFTMQDFYSIIVNTERKIFSKKKGSERVSKIIQDASSCAVNVISFGHCKHLIL